MKLPALLCVVFLCASALGAEVHMTKDAALKLYFPDATIERKTEYLSTEQKKAIKLKARAPVESGVITYYVGKKNNVPIGYAFFESVTVRTKAATYMVVVNPDGTVRGVEILAFYEPDDYKPSTRWLAQFQHKNIQDDLMLRSGIKNIAGATLSAQAFSDAVRRILSIYAIAIPK